jgi:D-alanine-D-alanine ligase
MKIAIITGGNSAERDVSIASAKNIAELVDFATVETFIFPEDENKFTKTYKIFDLAIPVIHGKGGEDGSIQGLFESLGIPYLFSGVEAHAIGIDKKRTKQVVNKLGYMAPRDVNKNDFPFFAKPRFGGSSVNSGLCNSEQDYLKLNQNEELILEEPIRGREFTVGVIEHKGEALALPVIEIVTASDTFFDYEQKYNSEKLAQEICPAQIPQVLSDKLKSIALAVHMQLGVKHISRSDFIVREDGEIYFLEINTIPGMTNTSLIPKMLKTANLDFKELLKEWCDKEYLSY